MAEIRILVSPDGREVKADVINGKGRNCDKLLAPVEALGGKVGKDQKKPEYYQQTVSQKVLA